MKKFSKEELENQVYTNIETKEKRKIKTVRQRKPKEGLDRTDFMIEVARRTGFQRKDVREIFDALNDVISDSIKDRKYVRIGHLTVYPAVTPARQGTNLRGGKSAEQMIIHPYWDCKVIVNKAFKAELKEVEVTDEDIKYVYLN